MSTENIEQLKKVIEILQSRHVSSVEVGFEYESDGTRYYTAISHKGAQQHRYRVRLWEDSDSDRYGKCNCRASGKNLLCRHLVKAVELDSEMFNIPIYAETVIGYKAHKHYEKAVQN